MSEFTPGPWHAWKSPTGAWLVMSVYRGFQDMRTTAFIATCDCQGQPNETNARMMAAAPALYAALKAVAPDGWLDDDTMDHMPGIKQARAALAAADGRDAEAKP